MMFGTKARLLRDLIARSDHPKKHAIMQAFARLTNGLRESIVHSYVRGDTPETVTFVERKKGGDYDIREHHFTLDSWSKHVTDFTRNGAAFHGTLGYTNEEMDAFGDAAVTASRTARKSSGQPGSSHRNRSSNGRS
jgi:hypothetical protein